MQQTMLRKSAVADTTRIGFAEKVLRRLESRIGKHKFSMWFARARVSVRGKRVEIAADSAFTANWIAKHFMHDIHEAARTVTGVDPDVELIVSSHGQMPAKASESSAAGSSSTGRRGSGAQENPGSPLPATKKPKVVRRLEDFVVGESNRLAYSAACRFAEDSDPRLLSPLFVHGPCGVGKTHLLLGACEQFRERWPQSRARYVPAEQFTNEYITAVRNDKIDEFRKRVRKLDMLAIDDVHFLSNKMRTQAEFLHTIDAIAMGGARVMLASDGHPRQISSLNQALISRFLSGMVVQIDLPDRALRSQLVRKIAAQRGLILAEAAADAIAARCVGTARELEGAIARLAALQTVEKGGATHAGAASCGPIGLVMVERLFGSIDALSGRAGSAPVRITVVIEAVCERLGVAMSDLMGSGRHQRIVLARALVAHLAREMTTMSYPEIAQAMGRRHHSTVHTAAARLAKQIAEGARLPNGSGDVALADFVDQLRHEIGKR